MLKLPAAKFVKQGESLRLECKVSGTAPLKMTWYKHDTKVTDGGNYRTSFVDSVAVLELLSTTFDDDGVYTCEAQNDAGSVSCSTTLTVKGQPHTDFINIFSSDALPVQCVIEVLVLLLKAGIRKSPPVFPTTAHRLSLFSLQQHNTSQLHHGPNNVSQKSTTLLVVLSKSTATHHPCCYPN